MSKPLGSFNNPIQPGHVPGLLEQFGIPQDYTPEVYCGAIQAFLAGHIDERRLSNLMGSDASPRGHGDRRKILPHERHLFPNIEF